MRKGRLGLQVQLKFAEADSVAHVLRYLLKEDDPQDAGSTKALPISQLKAWTKGRAWVFTDFELKDTVGKGTFSRVRVVKMKSSQERTPMVLKILRKGDVIRLKQVEHVKAEKQIMSMVEHPFIVNLLGAFQDDDLPLNDCSTGVNVPL
ncbi:pkgB [Symbiodinium sp. CCMP2592]|nr:pkgB [Symbiodinium sp. CCMP2592]